MMPMLLSTTAALLSFTTPFRAPSASWRTSAPLATVAEPTTTNVDPSDPAVIARRKELAKKFAANDGFFNRPSPEMMSEEFVFFGPIVGPLCRTDFLGTLGVFAVYESTSESKTDISEFVQDVRDPNRYWATRYYSAKHTAPLNTGAQELPATGNAIEIGPEPMSVTFDAADRVEKLTGGYISDNRLNPSGPFGASFALMKCIGGFVPPLWLAKILNWLGAKMANFPKGRSHALDLPAKWQSLGRNHGLRAADAWDAVPAAFQ